MRDNDEKLLQRLTNAQASARGTKLHAIAAINIEAGIALDVNGKYPVLARYVNDAIKYEMTPEQQLVYSEYCYGTADAISFDPTEMFIRVHDLKTGISKASFDQLYIYAAVFCHEYNLRPFELQGQLRIYQFEEPEYCDIDSAYLAWVYDRIRSAHNVAERKMMGAQD